jgi:hypothetical protein
MKARTWLARNLDKDMGYFKFLLTKMEDMGRALGSYRLGTKRRWGGLEALKTVGEDVGGNHEACY